MSSVLMGFVGDVLVNRERPQEIFDAVREILSAPAVTFANLEGAYTDHPQRFPGVPWLCSAPARNLDAIIGAGFDVLSLANNHILDVGYDAMLETRARLRAEGIQTCGAGDSLADAREPAVVEADGLKVAFLAYASFFPLGYEARANVPGLAPMRAYNFWREAFPNLHSPGMVPLVTTIPDETDLTNLAQDIRRAGERADLVITSFHWGDYTSRFHLTDHEKRTARYCIDQGADMVVGHHHHVPRGMEWYRGKPILYGLGHFVFDVRFDWSEEEFGKLLWEADPHNARYFEQVRSRGGAWPFPLGEDTRMSLLAWASASRSGVSDIGFLPCKIAADGRVHPLRLDSSEAQAIVSYLQQCNRTQGLESSIVADGSISIAGHSTLRVAPV